MLITLGFIAIIAGALIIAYHGFTYKKNEKIAQVGDLKVTAGTTKTIYLSPLAGAIFIAVGVLFMIIGIL